MPTPVFTYISEENPQLFSSEHILTLCEKNIQLYIYIGDEIGYAIVSKMLQEVVSLHLHGERYMVGRIDFPSVLQKTPSFLMVWRQHISSTPRKVYYDVDFLHDRLLPDGRVFVRKEGTAFFIEMKGITPCDGSVTPTENAIEHPSHYNTGSIETIAFIENHNLGFSEGNAVKYLTRAGVKNPDTLKEDLSKAAFYVKRLINKNHKRHFPDSGNAAGIIPPDTYCKDHKLSTNRTEAIIQICWGNYAAALEAIQKEIATIAI